MMEPDYTLLFIQPGVSWRSIPSIERMGLQADPRPERTRLQDSLGSHPDQCPRTGRKYLAHSPGALQDGFEVQPVILLAEYDIWRSVRTFHKYLERVRCDVICATGYKAGIITAFTPQSQPLRYCEAGRDTLLRF